MFVVGLTGGIGSGKSTFAALLAERGAQVIDADQLGRDALRPGEPAWHSVVAQFGDEILAAGSMDVDRVRLADIVFNSPEKLAALNAIVHPVVLRGIADNLERLRETDSVVVIDAALIVEIGLADALDALIVVTAPEEVRVERLVRSRPMSLAQVRKRMAAQLAEQALLARADFVVRNDGTIEKLVAEAERIWGDLETAAGTK